MGGVRSNRRPKPEERKRGEGARVEFIKANKLAMTRSRCDQPGVERVVLQPADSIPDLLC